MWWHGLDEACLEYGQVEVTCERGNEILGSI